MTEGAMPDIAANLASVRARIAAAAAAAGRQASAVSLVAVSKSHGADAVAAAIAAGQRLFGENRVQEATAKFRDLKARPAANQQGQGGGGVVRRHRDARPP